MASTIDNTRLISISNVLKNANNIFDYPCYAVPVPCHKNFHKFSLQDAQNPVKIILACERKILEQYQYTQRAL